jgi:hypothetical protein
MLPFSAAAYPSLFLLALAETFLFFFFFFFLHLEANSQGLIGGLDRETMLVVLEVLGCLVRDAELPVLGEDVPRGGLAVVAGHQPERQRLAGEVLPGLPHLPPVALHRRPLDALVPLHGRRHHVAGAAHVGDHHHVEVPVAGDGVADAALPHARHAPVRHLHDARLLLRDLQVRRHAQVQVLARRVAPPAIVAGLLVVGRAEVRGRDHQRRRRAGLAPVGAVHALDLVATAAGRAVAVQHRAHRHRLHAVALRRRVLVPARSRRRAGPVALAVERRVRRLPRARRELAVAVVHHKTARRHGLGAAGRCDMHQQRHQEERRPPTTRHDQLTANFFY